MAKARKTIERCCICRKQLIGEDRYGNNPWPARERGRCCNACNDMYVIPLRIAQFNARREKENVHT